ncbi:MAG: NUDIX domain-containing protein [Candidatus Saccharibacteria bacterium]
MLAIRKSSHGVGEYSLAGGHLEINESFEECALRELAEEAGSDIKVTKPKFLCVTNVRKYLPKHYADIGMVAEWISGEPIRMEPEKKEDWAWYDLDKLPSPVFGPLDNYIEAYKTGRVYFEE